MPSVLLQTAFFVSFQYMQKADAWEEDMKFSKWMKVKKLLI